MPTAGFYFPTAEIQTRIEKFSLKNFPK